MHAQHLHLIGHRPDQVRLQRLRAFADRADRSLAISLADLAPDAWQGPRAELAQRMLERNLAQLAGARSRLQRTIDGLAR